MAIQNGEMILMQKMHGIRFPYRTPLTFVPSDKTTEFFDNMETDCDFKRWDLHVTGHQSIIERSTWTCLVHINKVCRPVITLLSYSFV